ncbi:MAG TPA: hypothetical protein VHF23_08485 [Gaiellaceae bacterium]|nr:hypothetical protein [Gaiellaceae bacterium]
MTVERINELAPRKGAVLYALVMTAWVVGFAGTDHPLPAVVVFVLLVLPAALHFGLGYVVQDWWALYLTSVPVVVAAVAGGLPSGLWAAVVLLTAFPGAPLVALGVWVRRRLEERDPSYVDPWLI